MKPNEVTLEEEQAIRDRCKEGSEAWFENGIAMYKCVVCGKSFCIHDLSAWVFKRRIWNGRKARTLYLCSYPCSRKYDKVFGK